MEDHYCVTGNIPPQIPGKTTYNGQKNYCIYEQDLSNPDYVSADWEHIELMREDLARFRVKHQLNKELSVKLTQIIAALKLIQEDL